MSKICFHVLPHKHETMRLTYGPPKAVDREFFKTPKPPRPQNPKPLNPKIGIFYFFTGVLGPGRCLDGFVRHFSSRYTPSDPKISILDPKSFKFYRKSGPQVFLKIDAVNRDRAVPRLRFELSGSPRSMSGAPRPRLAKVTRN